MFSGIGAQRKALERLDIPHKVVGISEIDKYAIKSYEAVFGQTRNYGDISKIDKLDYADFWTYSFCCQDLSVAGKMKGFIDQETGERTRSGLLYEVQRLLDVAKKHNELPKYLMLENVKNLVGKQFKPYFDEWLQYLSSIGYNNYWEILNAKDYGVPQNRERVFAISIREDIDTHTFKFPEKFDSGIRLQSLLDETVDEKYYIDKAKSDRLVEKLIGGTQTTGCFVSKQGQEIGDTTDVCSTLMARDFKGFGNQRMTGVLEVHKSQNELVKLGQLESKFESVNRAYSPLGVSPTSDRAKSHPARRQFVRKSGIFVLAGCFS